ncbi:TRIC cation channel family protein, partial [Streptomyces noursei]
MADADQLVPGPKYPRSIGGAATAVLTGVAGEVIRDVLCGEFPPLLLREDVYAI